MTDKTKNIKRENELTAEIEQLERQLKAAMARQQSGALSKSAREEAAREAQRIADKLKELTRELLEVGALAEIERKALPDASELEHGAYELLVELERLQEKAERLAAKHKHLQDDFRVANIWHLAAYVSRLASVELTKLSASYPDYFELDAKSNVRKLKK